MAHILISENEPLVALDLEEILERVGATSFDYADTEDLAINVLLSDAPILSFRMSNSLEERALERSCE